MDDPLVITGIATRKEAESEARRRYGDKEVQKWIDAPSQNQACWRCGRHFGFRCECTTEELKEWDLMRRGVTQKGVQQGGVTQIVTRICEDCFGGFEGRGRVCPKCRMRRSRAKVRAWLKSGASSAKRGTTGWLTRTGGSGRWRRSRGTTCAVPGAGVNCW